MLTQIEFEVVKKSQAISRTKIFCIAFIGIFLMVVLKKMGVEPPKIQINELKTTVQKEDVIQKLLPKIEKKPNTIRIEGMSFSPIEKAYAQSDFDNSRAYEVIDLDSDRVIIQSNSDLKLPIASLTKIMSAIVTLDVTSPSEEFKVTRKAQNITPTRMGVIVGQSLNSDELLHAMLMTSANDAAEVLSDGIDKKYGKGTFVRLMNEKAKFIGLSNTHFSNPQGFDSSKNYSSASDVVLLSAYALSNYPQIEEIVNKDYYFIAKNQNHSIFDLYNWNGLLDVYPGVYGLKIGNTDDAGYTTVVASNREGRHILAVLLGAPGILERDLWASELLDEGFKQELNLEPVNVNKDQLIAKYATWKYFN